MKKKFYGVAGVNGYGVYDNYKTVLKNREYVKSHHVKGFQAYADAEAYAYNTYKKLQNGQPDFYEIPKIDRINWFFRRENKHPHPLEKGAEQGQVSRKPFLVGIQAE